MLNELLKAMGEETVQEGETIMGFRAKAGGKMVLVKEPAGDPELLAAYGESLYVNLPIEPLQFNLMYAVYLSFLHAMNRRPAMWRRFKIAQGKHVIDRLT